MPAPNNIRMFDRLCRLLYPQEGDEKRFTQDSPILAEVWLAFAQTKNDGRIDVLLNPDYKVDPGILVAELRRRGLNSADHRLAYNESHVVASVRLEELITIVLPLSGWWQRIATAVGDNKAVDGAFRAEFAKRWRKSLGDPIHSSEALFELSYLARVVREILSRRVKKQDRDLMEQREATDTTIREWFNRSLEDKRFTTPLLFQVSMNRPASPSVYRSRETIKADAATRVFGIKCDQIAWAVIDTGIDARHPAFLCPNKDGQPSSRVARTFDFTRLRVLLNAEDQPASGSPFSHLDPDDYESIQTQVRQRLISGLQIDWDLVAPCLEIPHDFDPTQRSLKGEVRSAPQSGTYIPPSADHGTHVAGILGADWNAADPLLQQVQTFSVSDRLNLTELATGDGLKGVCPDITLYDLRVFGTNDEGDEFAILAALQFVRYLNSSKSKKLIHGVNLSLSLEHKVRSYACGRTPVCDECERLVSNGVVVVVAAGNAGYDDGPNLGLFGSYRQSSITDPGNAESVITVGATHRNMPHTYGVSYFSSRGPTGDGRAKPDLVAPGERIFSTVPGASAKTMDGTSMAAPHVSGAAALLMARHSELVGDPTRIKELLCKTATDLGRTLNYQGAGLLDALRALESL
jgi:serine protease AprX